MLKSYYQTNKTKILLRERKSYLMPVKLFELKLKEPGLWFELNTPAYNV